MKYRLLNLFRAVGVLRLVDRIRFVVQVIKNQPSNRRFRSEFPDFRVPPRLLSYDAYNKVDWYSYKTLGLMQAQELVRVIRKEQLPEELQILEWGCGPARLIQHMPALFPAPHRIHLTGSDYNPQSIAWCSSAFPEIRFVLNALNPPLPFEENQFDIIYNFSVLTHLSEKVEMTWIEELKRVLKPGGLLVCTTHGENYRHLLTSKEDLRKYQSGCMVQQAGYAEGKKWYLAIHPEKFVREKLLAGFEKVYKADASPGSPILQDVWVGRKPLSRTEPISGVIRAQTV